MALDDAWTFLRTDTGIGTPVPYTGSDGQIAFADGLWVVAGANLTGSPYKLVVSVSTDPLTSWTNKVNLTATYPSPSRLLSWGAGKWAMLDYDTIRYTEDDWDTYSTVTPFSAGVQLYDLAFDGTYWALIRDNNNLYYASSLAGSWTLITRATLGIGSGSGIYGPVKVSTNGSRWVVAANGVNGSTMMATSTSLTGGSWSSSLTAPASGSASPRLLRWLPTSEEWAISFTSSASGSRGLFSAPANASTWTKLTTQPGLSEVYGIASTDGYFATYGRQSGSTTERVYWKETDTLATDAAWTVVPTNLNADGSQNTLLDLGTDGEVFALVGKPSGQSYNGVSISDTTVADGDGWGLILA